LLVAVSQSPRNLAAHDALGALFREHLERPADAFAHEGRALSLRQELALQQQASINALPKPTADRAGAKGPSPAVAASPHNGSIPGSAGILAGESSDPNRQQGCPRSQDNSLITIVSGLPRTGTSMMMQVLIAAGREPLTDRHRRPDEHNPLGYFEYQQASALLKDSSWLPLARGKVVKIVAQLLPALPRNQTYRIIFMERDLNEVLASQNAMLARSGRSGANIASSQLIEAYEAQLNRVRIEISRRSEIQLLIVNYNQLVADPENGIAPIAEFLGPPFDSSAAVRAVHPNLRRQINRSPAHP
jgi:hypothetical protein